MQRIDRQPELAQLEMQMRSGAPACAARYAQRLIRNHELASVLPLDDESPAFAGLSEVGGTGLEPVTPSLSSWCSPN